MDETPANHGILTISTHVFPQDFHGSKAGIRILSGQSLEVSATEWWVKWHVSLFRIDMDVSKIKEWGDPSSDPFNNQRPVWIAL